MTHHDREGEHPPRAAPTADAEGAANQLGQDVAIEATNNDAIAKNNDPNDKNNAANAKPTAAPGSGGLGSRLSDSAGQGRNPAEAIDSLPENATQPGGEPQATVEPGRARRPDEGADEMPPAGPHADPGLVNNDATPGAGTLTPEGDHDDVDSTSS